MNVKKRVFALFLVIICLFSYVSASAHNAYFLAITRDPATMEYMAHVSYEDTGIVDSGKHTEQKLGAIYTMADGWSTIASEYSNLLNNDSTDEAALRTFYIGDEKDTKGTTGMLSWNSDGIPTDACMAFTFPGLHPGFWDFSYTGCSGDGKDQRLAERVAEYAVKDLNACLSFIKAQCYKGKVPDIKDFRVLASKVASYASSNLSNSGGTSYTINGVSVNFSKATSISPTSDSGLDRSDYIKVTINGTSREFCFRCPKGYYEKLSTSRTDPLAAIKGESYTKGLHNSDGAGDVKFIDWNLIVLQGNYNADVSKITFSNLEELVNPGVFVQLVSKLLKWIVTGVTSVLQLKGYEDYFLMRGQVATDWVYGMFPEGWLAPMLLLYSVCLTLAMSLIGFSILKILWKKQLSTVNIGEKIAMQESIKNLIVTLFLFFAFIPIFIFLAGLNAALVQLFASSVTSGAMTTLITISYVSFGSILLGIVELILKIYFNFFYVARGITIAVLVSISPLAIYSLSLGGKTSGVFTAFFKELISQIFVQAVHALIAAFFFNAISYASMTAFEKIVALYSFIPIAKFVKTKVFQLTEGPAGQVASTGSNLAAGAISGAAKAAGNAGKGGKGGGGADSGGGNSSGGSGSLSGEGLLSGAMDRAASQQRSAAAKTGNAPVLKDSAGVEVPGAKTAYSSGFNAAGTNPFAKGSGKAVLNAAKQVGPDIKDAWQSGQGRKKPIGAIYAAASAAGNVGSKLGDMAFGTGMIGEANRAVGKTAAGSIGNMAAGSLYGGLALGMGAIGENPNKYAEMSAKHHVTGQKMAGKALYDSYQYNKAGGLINQQVIAMESAGINGYSTNGGFARYDVDSTKASEQHQAIYRDLKDAYAENVAGISPEQQEAAKAYYRDNYGIQNVHLNPVNGNAMSIDMEMAKMEAHRISETDPFEQMKAFKWKSENKK